MGLNDNPKSEVNRELRGIDKAGTKDLWTRDNPKQTVERTPDKDTK
jgi:hypothetical protein